VHLSNSYIRVIPPDVLGRYDWVETRQAAAVMKASNPQEFADLMEVLGAFAVDETRDIKSAGGNQSPTAVLLNGSFRERGWREGNYQLYVRSSLRRLPWAPAGEKKSDLVETEADTASFLIDNIKGRVAIDVEWHAKEGHLDRDLAAYRSLYQEAVIDVAAIVTMTRAEMRAWAVKLDPSTSKFKTSTATSVEKAKPKLQRGDAGGCPVLVIGVCRRTV
jgi:hypothetical protein